MSFSRFSLISSQCSIAILLLHWTKYKYRSVGKNLSYTGNMRAGTVSQENFLKTAPFNLPLNASLRNLAVCD